MCDACCKCATYSLQSLSPAVSSVQYFSVLAVLLQTCCCSPHWLIPHLQPWCLPSVTQGSHQWLTTSIQVSESNGSISSRNDWTNVWHLSLSVMASMLRTLRHGFLKEALDFAGVHRERLARAMDMIRASQSTRALQEAEDVTVFLFELGHFAKEWRFGLLDVLELLLVMGCYHCLPCYSLIKTNSRDRLMGNRILSIK